MAGPRFLKAYIIISLAICCDSKKYPLSVWYLAVFKKNLINYTGLDPTKYRDEIWLFSIRLPKRKQATCWKLILGISWENLAPVDEMLQQGRLWQDETLSLDILSIDFYFGQYLKLRCTKKQKYFHSPFKKKEIHGRYRATLSRGFWAAVEHGSQRVKYPAAI